MSTPDFRPTLTGPRITVRPLVAADWDGLYSAASDPEIWAQHPVTDRYREEVFRAYFDAALASGAAFVFVDRNKDRIFGSSRYFDYSPAASRIEIGWTFIARDWWGGSYNSEIKTLMLEHAFGFVDTVVFWVGETNWRSQRAMEKIGGVRREGLHTRVVDGVQHGMHVVFDIRKADWQAKRV